MNSHEFIVSQVAKKLVDEGFSEYVANQCAEEALSYYKATARFKKSAIADCIKFAQSKARKMK